MEFPVNNEFFSGGMFLLVIGGLLAWAKNLPIKLLRVLRHRAVSQLTIEDNDPAYPWVRRWLSQQLKGRRIRTAKVLIDFSGTEVAPSLHSVSPASTTPEHRPKPNITMRPAEGMYVVRFRGRRILVSVSSEDKKIGNEFVIGTRERIVFTTLGRAETLFSQLVLEAFEAMEQSKRRLIAICMPSYNSWITADERLPRPPASLVFADGLYAMVADRVQCFLTSRERYTQLGIPWRFGMLFKGPPGNGKSSLALALAGQFGCNVRLLQLSPGLTNEALQLLMAAVPAGDIILMEDVDAAFHGREATSDEIKLTFSGLLNAIDGAGSREGRMLVMTTNHPEQLDPALTRPGRVDLSVQVNNACAAQARQMFLRFFPDASLGLSGYFADCFDDDPLNSTVSMASIQRMLIDAGSPLAAVKAARQLPLGVSPGEQLLAQSTRVATALSRLHNGNGVCADDPDPLPAENLY